LNEIMRLTDSTIDDVAPMFDGTNEDLKQNFERQHQEYHEKKVIIEQQDEKSRKMIIHEISRCKTRVRTKIRKNSTLGNEAKSI